MHIHVGCMIIIQIFTESNLAEGRDNQQCPHSCKLVLPSSCLSNPRCGPVAYILMHALMFIQAVHGEICNHMHALH